jgi:hypothetical protein
MKTTTTTTITRLQWKIFNFLNDLREDGSTNMFGAGPFIVSEFGIDIKEAIHHLHLWMHNYTGQKFWEENAELKPLPTKN